jgi:hypothetical protein
MIARLRRHWVASVKANQGNVGDTLTFEPGSA